MTVGQKIRQLRKDKGLSQEQLGQQLLVSRQTVSQWEMDETVPTLDNVLRLRQLFGVSVDAILGMEEEPQEAPAPRESYRFTYTREEMQQLVALQLRPLRKNAVKFGILGTLLILFGAAAGLPEIAMGILVGCLLAGTINHVKGIRAYGRAWKQSAEEVPGKVYEYRVFEDHFTLKVTKEGEILRQSRCDFSRIEKLDFLGEWLLVQYGGQLLILRKGELQPDSAFRLPMARPELSVQKKPPEGKWKLLSNVLFVLSLLSLIGALHLESLAMGTTGTMVESMWVFFLPAPIPIASIVVGFILKRKGYRYKKNVIVGIIMTALLCVYGSFPFLFSDLYDHTAEPVLRAEALLETDLPEPIRINTMDMTQGTQSDQRCYMYYQSDVYLDAAGSEEFEKIISEDQRWLTTVPNDLVGILPMQAAYAVCDRVLICNLDTGLYNTLPEESGTYRFLCVLFYTNEDRLEIIEYDMTCEE